MVSKQERERKKENKNIRNILVIYFETKRETI